MRLYPKLVYLLLFFSVCTEQVYAKEVKFIEVFGQASLSPVKAQQELTLSLQEQGGSIAKTVNRVNLKRQHIIKALTKQGIKQNEIIVSEIGIRSVSQGTNVDIDKVYLPTKHHAVIATQGTPQPTPKQKSLNSQQGIYQVSNSKDRLYTVSQLVKCEIEDVNQLSQTLDKLNRLSIEGFNVSYARHDVTEQYSKVLNLAIDNAKTKAKAIAHSLNVKLEQVLEVQELTPTDYTPYTAANSFENTVKGDLKQSISAQVRISFAISSQ